MCSAISVLNYELYYRSICQNRIKSTFLRLFLTLFHVKQLLFGVLFEKKIGRFDVYFFTVAVGSLPYLYCVKTYVKNADKVFKLCLSTAK